jgi:hypothetical protein
MVVTDPSSFDARVEALTAALEASTDAHARDCAKELVHLVLEFHGSGLKRILDVLGDAPRLVAERATADPVVASLLALHGLLPEEQPQTRLIQITRSPAEAHERMLHAPDSTCERCGAPLSESHRHCVDLETRRLSCSCRACWLLAGADQRDRTLRAVPDRYRQGPSLQLSDPQWDALQVPVGIAFFMFNSSLGRTIAFYPSPAGATESALPLEAWTHVAVDNPWVRTAAPDVEAVLVRRTRDASDGCACFIVPIDACYDLVGRIRLHWAGFDGGDAVTAEIDRFFTGIVENAASAAATGLR